jgi:hypothetical protein
MHCNRMLRSAPAVQETVLHELLHRHHAGAMARRTAVAGRAPSSAATTAPAG